jgi:putative acyl-CoA dehydrogenase
MHGGEESVLPRLYREALVNAIWEGSGNVMCLDVLRALAHEGEAGRAVLGALIAADDARSLLERALPPPA